MITVIHNPSGPTWNADYEAGMTCGSLVQQIIDQYGLEIRGGWTLQDPHVQGRSLTTDEELTDGRVYWLNAWITNVRMPSGF
jgi:hypothetical protein